MSQQPSPPAAAILKKHRAQQHKTSSRIFKSIQLLLWSSVAVHAICGLTNAPGAAADPYGGGITSVGIHIPGGGVGILSETRCPRVCSCNGLTVDCSHRGLTQVPRKISADVERLDLQGNNITVIFESDFQHLTKLRILQLTDNQIHTIEKDAFQDLISLERLRLNNNRLKAIPENFVTSSASLLRLDISHNGITTIPRKGFKGAQSLRSLQMDNNQIMCMDEQAFKGLADLEILTLNNNNLTMLPHNAFTGLGRLRALRLSDNPFSCDCHLSWLSRFLRSAPRLAPYTKCHSPSQLKGQNVADLHDQDFKCSGLTENAPMECGAASSCPHPCRCADGVVNCREKSLTNVPNSLPDDTTELRLEQNYITELPPKAFANFRRLRRIDLSNNNISRIAHDALSGLKALTTLVLYGNKIKDLPSGVFKGLSSLQLLLLNANEISCIRKDAFKDLHSLTLLSLYDNNIQSLANGTFDSIKNIKTLHLARNPFICDCNLRWLADYLHKNPIETSGAKCDAPKRMQRRRIESLRDEKFKCSMDELRTKMANECRMDTECPASCHCDGTAVDCSARGLKEIPRDIPLYTTELLLNDNELGRIKSDGLFGRLPNLVKLDLKRNQITGIEPNAFEGASKIQDLQLGENKIKEVHNKMFLGLHHLKTLSLYDNTISCVMPGSFDFLTSLHSLNLASNPFNCNCHLAWFSDWLRKKGLIGGAARCASPSKVRDVQIKDLPHNEFKCTPDNNEGCLGDGYCPPSCTCTGTVVRCSRNKLKEIPKGIPPETSELYLESNDIAMIHMDRIAHLKSLTRLDLSNNQITILSNHTFANLTKLSTLIISYNKLQCLQRHALTGLHNLRVLSLHGNQISILPEGSFEDLKTITHIALGSNPLYCDCSLKWFSDWIKLDYVEPGIARCAEPESMKDKLILSTPSQYFSCKEKISNEILSKCDACYTMPCQNRGDCNPLPQRDYQCRCQPGYHGRHCEFMIDACYGNPCRNNATCTVLEEGRFSCQCSPGYTGVRCETNIDDCNGNKCHNNATCVDGVESYTCNCQPGFTGEYCDSKINFCSEEFNPCANEAKCVDHFTHYTCECMPGFHGVNCTDNIDDCQNHICQNGGTCVDGINDYVCKCPEEYTGKYCEGTPMVAMMYPQTSPCQNHECKHGVCFQPNPSGSDYLCKCHPGYSGKWCEYLTSISFVHNNSFAEMEPLRTKPEANVTIVFSTTQQNGILMYDGESEHLAVELFNGRIRVSYDVGNYPVSTMYSFEMVADGKYHMVELLAIKKNFTLRVDRGLARSIINEGSKDYLKLSAPLFLGGLPAEPGQQAYKNWHLRNLTSFKGCMKEVWINHKLVDFGNAARQQKITPGCGLLEGDNSEDDDEESYFMHETPHTYKEVDPCENHKCRRGGRCVPNSSSKDGYVCKCKQGTKGRYCDQASTCHKEQVREFYTENDCRSRQPLKYAKCVGGCGNQCCAAKVVRRRKDKDSESTENSDNRATIDSDELKEERESQTTDSYADEDERMQSNPSTDFYDDDDDDRDDYDDDEEDREYNDEEEPPIAAKRTALPDDEEEVDLGYDEDDEPPKRPSIHEDQQDFMNEEGSGSRSRGSGYKQSRFRLDYLEKFRKTHQKTYRADEADTDDGDDLDDDDDEDEAEPRREGSGNFANDDDDNEDDDDGGGGTNDGFFSSKRKSNSRYFRKNTNDAIKIISTPLGKVGIVYQQTPQEQPKTENASGSSKTQFTDFDALSPADPNTHRRASLHPKITPVLTADGKVALLYRGDSESSKYEPILNLTHKFNLYDNKTSATPSNNEDKDDDSSDQESAGDDDTSLDGEEEDSSDENSVTEQAASTPPPVLDVDRSNSVLPMINRPLSEVLGIKKNQFRQFRIKDSPSSTTTEPPFGLHFLTKKVNLAEYPSRSRNRDFDFSQDTTMLDERKRNNNNAQYQPASESQSDNAPDHTDASSIATQDILSKTEVVNLAIIPHFDEEFERQQRFRDHEIRRHHRQRHRHKHNQQDLSSIHCIMQATMGIAAISTVFGMLGTFFKQRILDQIRLMHW